MKHTKHIGFEGLEHKAMNFYENKGYSHEEALNIAKKVAGAVNRDYVHHYRTKKHRVY